MLASDLSEVERDFIGLLDEHVPRRGLVGDYRKLLKEFDELRLALDHQGAAEVESEAADVALSLLAMLVTMKTYKLPCSASLEAAMRKKVEILKQRAAAGTWPKPEDTRESEHGRTCAEECREQILALRGAIDIREAQIRGIAQEHIEDFFWLDHQVSTFWRCDDSPIGMCVFNLSDHGHPVDCRYCRQPPVRK